MPGCRGLSEVEIFRVREKLKIRRDKLLFTMGIRTGFRISELLALKTSDVYKNGVALHRVRIKRRYLKEKTKSREIALHDEARAMIEEYVPTLEPGQKNLFPSRSTGKSLTRFTAHKILKDAYTAVRLKGNLATHSMRKTFATNVYRKTGNNLIATKEALGHSSVETTLDYLQVNQETIDRAVLD